MGDSRTPDALVREIHQLVRGPARGTLEQACREWLEGRRQAIAGAPPWPEWQGENTQKNRKRHGELCKPREKHLPELPWPLDGREVGEEVDLAGHCAVLAIYHDANCARCERCPLFPMPLASDDLSDEEAKQAADDGVSWVLLRNALIGEPDADVMEPDADAMRDALEAVRAELRRRGVLSEPSPTSPAAKPSEAVTWESLAERFREMAYSEKPEEIPNTLNWVEVRTEETHGGDANGWRIEGQPSFADGSDIPKELFQNAARLAGRKLLSVNKLAGDLRSEQDDLRRWLRLLTTDPDIIRLRAIEEDEKKDGPSRRTVSMVGIVDASRLWCERFRTQGELEAEQPAPSTFWHSDMFTAVKWGTRDFTFKETQAACVCVM